MNLCRFRGIALAFVVVGLAACAASGHRSSPWEWGGGVRLAPGWAVGQGDLTIHPMGSYTYLSFDGGHDSLWELGAQVRKPTELMAEGSKGLWIGGEAAVSYLNTVIDAPGGDMSDGTSGFSATGLVGKPVGDSRWGLNLYLGAGLSRYGTTGTNIRAGVDLQPWFLKR